MHPLFKMAFDKNVQDTDFTGFAGPVTAFQRTAKTRHGDCYCTLSGGHTPSPVTPENRNRQNWHARLIESQGEV